MKDELYFCPLCNQREWHRITGLENHIWHMHEETKCCMSHSSKARSPNVDDCKGSLDMATCAARHVYRKAGLVWPRYRDTDKLAAVADHRKSG